MEEIKFLRSQINFRNEYIKSLFTSISRLHNELFFPHKSEQVKTFNKNFYQKADNLMGILEGHVDKSSNDSDVIK